MLLSRVLAVFSAVALTLSSSSIVFGQDESDAAAGPLTINWDDLLPDGEMEELARLYALSTAATNVDHFGAQSEQIGTFNVVEELIGETVRLPGFVLPLDAQIAGEVTEFLFVPYVGACVHMPPPPPNQIVYVLADRPIMIERNWEPIWAIGLLTSDQTHSGLGSTAYTLELTEVESYEY
ncbi:MAG: DUF3299 domain-containing protein [Henriciella sp.]|nr:DUF3299 domain-containing protein [Henriciella sp.]